MIKSNSDMSSESNFKKVNDIIVDNLDVLFVGINPGIETARTGHHFAHPSNRFWATLHKSGFTPRQLKPKEKEELLEYNLGITNVIERPTKGEIDLKNSEYENGKVILLNKIKIYNPLWVAFVGIGLYRKTFNKRDVLIGPQEEIYKSNVWVLPQPSGINAHYPPRKLIKEFSKLKNELNKSG